MATKTREPLWTVEQVAEHTGLAVQTLYNMHSQGRGPATKKIGRLLRYAPADVDAWIDQQTRTAS